jgi:hypothetical protein
VHPHLTLTQPAHAGAALDRALRQLDDVNPSDGTATLPLILAFLAAGRARRVRQPVLDLDGPLLPAALARYIAWTGDLTTAATAWPRVRNAAANISMDQQLPTAGQPDDSRDNLPDATLRRGDPASPGNALDHGNCTTDDDGGLGFTVAAAALFGAERLATDLGDPHFASRLHSRCSLARAALPHRIRSPAAVHLAVCLDLLPPDAVQTPPYGGDTALGALLDTAFLILGVQPDATRHRIWLRPRLPVGWDCVEAYEIQAGGDSIRLSVEAQAGLLRLRVEQEAGAIPVTALVEPFVPGRVAGVRIDGGAAALVPRAVEGGTRVPVQLVLDRGRTVEIDIAPGRP